MPRVVADRLETDFQHGQRPCPLAAALDKFQEAHFFLVQMTEWYHVPDPLRWNLNAFVTAIRSVPDIIRALLAREPEFYNWWDGHWQKFERDSVLSQFFAGRTVVVHRGMLESTSRVRGGVFRGRHPLGQASWDKWEEDLMDPSGILLDNLKHNVEMHVGGPVEHRTVGDQFGVQREWVVAELGGKAEIVGVCDIALTRTVRLLAETHDRFCGGLPRPMPDNEGPHHQIEECSVLLESDVDPLLPLDWGWPDNWEQEAEKLYAVVGRYGGSQELHCLPDLEQFAARKTRHWSTQ